eukprot:CAMPEP_0179453912 /NCGR_PEP_ID=MMETSP0799-20121207/37791_1 /TAXON_ID=46947 /ORGANISM="Geminigera cryophila, Strain CCMP2564" /LENGTH=193 /DNA_ID=CAMNT_0021251295 /DNA_START=192 /DNA_END=774 /DNA_ORIENTATION=+
MTSVTFKTLAGVRIHDNKGNSIGARRLSAKCLAAARPSTMAWRCSQTAKLCKHSNNFRGWSRSLRAATVEQIFDGSVTISDSSGTIARVFSGAMSPRPLPPDVTHCLGRDVVLFAKLYRHARRLAVLLLVDEDGVTCRQPDSIATDNLCHCLPCNLITIDCGGKAGECRQRTDIIRVRGCGSPGAWTPCKHNV